MRRKSSSHSGAGVLSAKQSRQRRYRTRPLRDACRLLAGIGLAALLAVMPLAAQSPAPGTPQSLPADAARNKPDTKKGKKEYEAGLRAERAGDWAAAFAHYGQAQDLSPDNRQYQLRCALARFQLVQEHTARAEQQAVAGRFQAAREELEAALKIDPGYSVARERLDQIQSLAQRQPAEVPLGDDATPQIHPTPGNHSFNYRGDTEGAYNEVARQFGVTASFDSELRRKTVRFRVDDVDFWMAMRLLSQMTSTFWRPVNARLFFVADSTPQKLKDYDLSIVRSVILPESDSPDQLNETLRLVREIGGITRTQLDMGTRTLTLRASPQKVALALDLVKQAEQARGELMLEVDILEVDRNEERKLGIQVPTSARIFTISPTQILQAEQSTQSLLQIISQIFGSPSAVSGLTTGQVGALLGAGQLSIGALLPPLIAFGGGRTTFLATLPGAAAQFSEALSVIRHGQHMLLRAEDGKKASFFIGDRFPISLATLSASLGTPQFIATINPSSSNNFPRTDFATGNGPVSVVTGDFNGDGILDLAVADNAGSTITGASGSTNGVGDGGSPTSAILASPTGIAVDSAGNYFIADAAHQRIRFVNTTTGVITTVAGNGTACSNPASSTSPCGDGGPATSAQLNSPLGVAVDVLGNLFIADSVDNRVREVFCSDSAITCTPASGSKGDITTVAGNGTACSNTTSTTSPCGDGGPATSAQLNSPAGVAVDVLGNLFIADSRDNRVREVFCANAASSCKPPPGSSAGNITTNAGNGAASFAGDGGPATAASLNQPQGVAVDAVGNLYIADTLDERIRLVQLGTGIINTVAGSGTLGTVSILLGNGTNGTGDGTFGTKTDFPVGRAPAAVIAADFNGDGHADLAVANSGENTVSILLGNGDGTFQPAKSFATGDTPVALAAADFNGDGILDLAVVNKCPNPTQTNCTPSVSILLGNGDGTFQAKTDFPTGNQPNSIAVRDFNGDGLLDLAVTNGTDNTVSILLGKGTNGKGDGTFQPRADFQTGNGPAAVVAADFNQDGNVDLAVANQTDNTVSILFGNGNATPLFQPKVDFTTLPINQTGTSGTGPVALATADFNLDSFPDLVTADQSGNAISVLINNGLGGFVTPLALATGNSPVSVATGDFNGDGRPDVVTANQTSNTVSVILNTITLISSGSSAGAAQQAYPSAQYVDLGLKVEATPRLHPNDEVTLKLQIEIKSLSGSNFNGIPVITNRTVEQMVRLREGETSVLAGLMEPHSTRNVTTWPGLDRVVGPYYDTQKQDTEMIILVTPRLIRLAPRVERTFYAGQGGEPAAPTSTAP